MREMGKQRRVPPFGIRDKVGYMCGDIGNDLFFIFVSSFLMVYYTDVLHISAAAIGTMFLIARLWDGAADVVWGRFLDGRAPERHGKFRPWIWRMSIPLVISGILMFIKIPGMSDEFYLVYAFITYLLWGTLYSTVNIPYGSMAAVITSQPSERTALSTFRTLGANVAGLLVQAGGPLLLFIHNQAAAGRFILAAVLFGAAAVFSYRQCYRLSVERLVPVPGQRASFRQTLQQLARNRPFLAILLASLLFMMCSLLLSAINVYLYKDYFANAKALSIIGLLQIVTICGSMPLVTSCVHRFGKKETAAAGAALAASAYACLYVLPGADIGLFLALSTVGMLGSACFQLIIWAFVTDVMDYHEYITGSRTDGTVYAVYSFARKVGQAFAGGLSGYALAAAGYDAASHVQPPAVLAGIRALATGGPALIFLFIFLLLLAYPLNRTRVQVMFRELETRRKPGRK